MTDETRKSASDGQESKRRKPIDWDAVERDYRATQMTVRELAEKHGCTHGRIVQRAKAYEWSRDLSGFIKHATDANLVKASVSAMLTSQANRELQELTNVVMVAAEVNTQVILGHRKRIANLYQDVDAAKTKLMEVGQSVADVREAATLVQAVVNLTAATKTLIGLEREAFGITSEADEVAGKPVKRVMLDFVDVVAK